MGLRRLQRVALQSRRRSRQVRVRLRVLQRRRQRLQPVSDALDGGVNPTGVSDVSGPFSQTTFSQGIFDLIVGLRYDRYALEARAVRPQRHAAAARLTARPLHGRQVRWRGSSPSDARRARARLAAAVHDLFGIHARPDRLGNLDGRHPSADGDALRRIPPNPFLDPEIQKGWEFGFNVWQDSVLDAAATAFRFKADYFTMDVDNYVTGVCLAAVARTGLRRDDPTSATLAGQVGGEGVEVQRHVRCRLRLRRRQLHLHRHRTCPSQIDGFGAQSYLPDHILTLTGGVRLLEREADARRARVLSSRRAYNGADQGSGAPVHRSAQSQRKSRIMHRLRAGRLLLELQVDRGVELGATSTTCSTRSTRRPCRRRSRGHQVLRLQPGRMHRPGHRPHVPPHGAGAILSVFARNVGTR